MLLCDLSRSFSRVLLTVCVVWSDPNLTIDGTQHFYLSILEPATFARARAIASAARYRGLQGYLVTLGSRAESAFVARLLSGGGAIPSNAWSSLREFPAKSLAYHWADGPAGEAGAQVWQGAADGHTVDGRFASWAPGSPVGAPCVLIGGIDGDQWRDASCEFEYKFVIEFSGACLLGCFANSFW